MPIVQGTLIVLVLLSTLPPQVEGLTAQTLIDWTDEAPTLDGGAAIEGFDLGVSALAGSTYLLWDHHGGWWSDAEKTKDNDDDDLMCWAASAANVLEWTGWGWTDGKTSTDEMFQYSLAYWDDRTGWPTSAWYWWFNNGSFADVPGGGNFWPTYLWSTYVHEQNDPALALAAIDDFLHAGYAVAIGIWDGGHVITCWGFQYDDAFNKTTQPADYYLGIWVTDSDDDKGWEGPAVDAPNSLRYLPVAWNGTVWKFTAGYGGWHVSGICGLEPYPNNQRPIADAGGPYVGLEGSPILFDGSGSNDPDGDPLMYRWDFDNDGLWDTGWSSSPSVNHTYADDYTGTVVLNVYDSQTNGSLQDGATASVVVTNVNPVIDALTLTPPNDQFILPTVHGLTFTGSFTDAGIGDTHTAVWAWGDSTTSGGTVVEAGGSGTATGTHTYSTPGVYTVTLTVTDDDGGDCVDMTTVTVVTVEDALHITAEYLHDLPDEAFTANPSQRLKALANMFSAIDAMLANDAYRGVIHSLRSNIRSKADGHIDGKLQNDWLVDPVVQAELCHKLDDILAYLKTLL